MTAMLPSASSDVVALLCDRSAHADRPNSIERRETHISWLFVTDHYVYKLKKPVRFDFVDFTTLDLRHRACLDEVRLNCRLAPNVYIGVLPITKAAHGRLELAGRGEAVDWVVKMRRLPADAALDHRLAEGRVSIDEADSLVEQLAEFYDRLPAETLTGKAYRAALEKNIRRNAAVCIKKVSKFDRDRVQQIFGNQLRFLRVATEAFDERAVGGHIVDGHGDLRPEHIFLESPPAVIDCIEFSAELRRVDVLDDLSFLAMECDRLGHSVFGAQIVAECQQRRGDRVDARLFDFYKSYRALVRAKVQLLEAQQHTDGQRRALERRSHQYLDWAEYCAARLGRPTLVAVGGLMGTGKSTLAAQIARALGADLVATDRVRRALYGRSQTPAGFGEGLYAPDRRARVYEQLFVRAAHALDKGLSVVVDGTFLTDELRGQAKELARQHGAVPLLVHCHCPRQVAMKRLAVRTDRRASDSEGRVDLREEQAAAEEQFVEDRWSVAVDTTETMAEQLHRVIRAIAAGESGRHHLADGAGSLRTVPASG